MLQVHKSTRALAVGLSLVCGLFMAATGDAQTRPPAPGNGRPAFDPAALREQIMSSMKTAINCTDDEWKVIEPKLVKVMLLKMDTGALGIARGGRNGARVTAFIRNLLDPSALPSPVDEKMTELQTLIDQNETSTDSYRNKVAQLRHARDQAKEQLAVAEKDVIALLTVRQEAALVDMGVLE